MSIKNPKLNLLRLSAMVFTSMVIMLGAGCIERKFVIITSPADSEIYLDGKYMGNSKLINPKDGKTGRIDIPFVYYAQREIVVKNKNYETRREYLKPTTPWFDFFPIDFFAEVLLPYTLKVQFVYRIDLNEYDDINAEDLYDKSEEMRDYAAGKLSKHTEIEE